MRGANRNQPPGPKVSRPLHRAAASVLLLLLAGNAPAQQTAPASPHANAVLVELFTSEGCSSCPPADELLRQVNGHTTHQGQLIVGLSEHVTYWNRLGWQDPFSSDLFTARQNQYGGRFGLDSVYTPQMVVNGREQFVGGDRRALEAAFTAEAQRKQIALRILDARIADRTLTVNYSASDLPAKGSLRLIAVLTDDTARSRVLRGENSGRDLVHVSVARMVIPLGKLETANERTISVPLPGSYPASNSPHHLVLFAQQDDGGAVVGVDTRPL